VGGNLPPAGGALPVGRPGRYLLDPNPAVTRAGLVADLGRRLGAWQLDGRIAFLSADDPVRTPFARLLRVERSLPWDVAVLARQLRGLGVGAVDVRRRGLAGDVAQVARRLRLRGGRKMTLVMTRVAGRPWALVCVEPGEPAL
ncbi:MAG TPA: class I SAM-dependent methyltransferase, partial [Frankiaceae bacterium]|nr:class I SAM-dependent methyltransferase [Frankiaceae bacterium]